MQPRARREAADLLGIAPRVIGLVMLAVALVSGCSRSDGSPSAVATIAPDDSPSAAAAIAPDGGLRGAHVHVLGLWSGPEFDSFVAVKSVWEKETGAVVDWEASTDLARALADHETGRRSTARSRSCRTSR